MSKGLIYTVSFLMAFLITACQEEAFNFGKKDKSTGEKVVLSGRLIHLGNTVMTRSVSETSIGRIDVMLFDEDSTFVEWSRAELVSSAAGISEYRCVFTTTNKKRILSYIVNYPFDETSFTASFFAGMHMGEAMSYIVDDTRYNDDDNHLMQMWGITTLPLIEDDTDIPDVSVLRDVAKVTINIPLEVRHQLSLDEVVLYNTLETGQLAPGSFSTDPVDWIRATEPKIKTLDTVNITLANNYSAVFYAFERRVESLSMASEDACFIILKGIYSDDASDDYSYYKIILAEYHPEESDPDARFSPYEILRNTQYEVTLQSIAGRGYPTLEEALMRPPSNNITYETVSSNADVQDEVTNGQYKLGISRSEFNLYEQPSLITYIKIANIYVSDVEGGGAGGVNPGIEDAYCIVESNENNLLLKADMSPYEAGDTIYLSAGGELWSYVQQYDSTIVRTADVKVQVGNLRRSIEIYQSNFFKFSLPDVLYVGWELGNQVVLTVEVEEAKTYPVTVNISLHDGANAFMSIVGTGVEEIPNASVKELTFDLVTNVGYYGMYEGSIYRTTQVIVSAEGFLTDTVVIKQSKYWDGVVGNGVVGIYRDDNDNSIYPLSLVDTEESWELRVTQGADWINIYPNGDYSSPDSLLTGDREVRFAYSLEQNTSGVNRYGKIELAFGGRLASHVVYVAQGFRDVTIGGSIWAARNTFEYRTFAPSPDDPGSFYKRGDGSVYFDAHNPSWGEPYTNGGSGYNYSNAYSTASNWSVQPCPSGYTLPNLDASNGLATEISYNNVGNSEIVGKQGFNHMFFGYVNRSTERSSPGLLYVNEVNGVVNNIFFLPTAGFRYGENGILSTIHILATAPDVNNYCYTSGIYLLSNYSGSFYIMDVYHDNNNNIGIWHGATINTNSTLSSRLTTAERNYITTPIRCVRSNP